MCNRVVSLSIVLLAFVSLMPLGQANAEQVVAVRITADSENAGYEAFRAMDGDPGSMWHTQFNTPPRAGASDRPAIPFRCGYGAGCAREHFNALPFQTGENTTAPPAPAQPRPSTGNNVAPPHEIIVDLTRSFDIRGIVQQARSGTGNGTIGRYELYVADDSACEEGCDSHWGKPVQRGRFAKVNTPQTVEFAQPVRGRYLKLVALTELNGQPFSSVAELQILVDGVRFVADTVYGGPGWTPVSYQQGTEWGATGELTDQYNLIMQEFDRPEYYGGIHDQVYRAEATILPADRDAADVVMRRTTALFNDLRGQGGMRLDPDAIGKQLARLKAQTAGDATDRARRFSLYVEICTLRRRIAFSNPLLDFEDILFIKKHRSKFQHMCDQFYGVNTPSGGGLFVLTNAFSTNQTPELRNILAGKKVTAGRLAGTELTGGAFLSPDLSYDGTRIAFAYVECTGTAGDSYSGHIPHLDLSRGHWERGRCYHIFTCNADGSDLRQITDGTWNDFDPCFLPNGRIAFISERRGGYLRCGRACPNYTLFDMDPDGRRMRCLNYHETNEWNPSVTNDGKILYTRWDYIDRFGCIAHHPWVTSIDGRDPRAVHGNFSPRHWRPDGEFDCRAIPGSPKYIATAGPHHGLSFGSLILIDPQIEDDNAMGPVKRITPDVGFPESQNGGQVIGTAWPLSEDYYLAVADYRFQPGSRVGKGQSRGQYGLYLYDAFGNRELIYYDPEIAVASPIPFVPRRSPTLTTTLVATDDIPHQPYVDHPSSPSLAGRPTGTVMIQDVYESMDKWPANTKITALRVVQVYTMSVPSGGPSVGQPHEIGFREASSPDSVNLARGVLGTAPVEADGSVHFEVPANCEIYFQALDEDGLAVHSMRSGTCLHEGEQLSCVGCHERKNSAPPRPAETALAFRRAPSKLRPDVPGTRPANFPELIQPILDKHCVGCHETPESREKRAPILTREPIERKQNRNWYASYQSLVGGGYAFYSYGDPLRSIPGKVGAHASKLYPMLKQGHHDVQLSDEELHKFAVWLDLLSNFYGVYEAAGGIAQLRGEKAYPTLE